MEATIPFAFLARMVVEGEQEVRMKDLLVHATRYDGALPSGGYAFATVMDSNLEILLCCSPQL